jgi:capsular polysaccharide biosynthesis protein
VEANEALRRIVVRHRRLIGALVVLSLAVVVPWRLLKTPSYQATARIQAQATAPDVDTQAAAILDRASAVAVSPAVVRSALDAAHLQMPAGWVASREISATSLGGSAVITLTVTAPTAHEATGLARALPGAVVSALNQLATLQTDPAMATLNQQISQLTSERNGLLNQINSPANRDTQSVTAGESALLAELTAVNTQLSSLMSTQQQLLATANTNGSAGVISLPDHATTTSRGVVTYGVLAALLGLVLGLLVATLHEVLRPSIADAETAARDLDVPVLGRIDEAAGRTEPADRGLLTRIDLAARRAAVETLVVTGPVAAGTLIDLAAGLERQLAALHARPAGEPDGAGRGHGKPLTADSNGGARRITQEGGKMPGPGELNGGAGGALDLPTMVTPRHAAGAGRTSLALRALAVGELSPGATPVAPALVAMIPDFGPHGELDRISDLSAATGWPVLGVIGIQPARPTGHRHDRRDMTDAIDEGILP